MYIVHVHLYMYMYDMYIYMYIFSRLAIVAVCQLCFTAFARMQGTVHVHEFSCMM